MALDATQIETLRNGLVCTFTFEDLDLVLRKCFGKRKDHDMTAASSQAQVAQECIRSSRRGVTVIFLRYL